MPSLTKSIIWGALAGAGFLIGYNVYGGSKEAEDEKVAKGHFLKKCPSFDPKTAANKRYAMVHIRKASLEPDGSLKLRISVWGPPVKELSFGLCHLKSGLQDGKLVVRETIFAEYDNGSHKGPIKDQELDVQFPNHLKTLEGATPVSGRRFILSLGNDVMDADSLKRYELSVDAKR